MSDIEIIIKCLRDEVNACDARPERIRPEDALANLATRLEDAMAKEVALKSPITPPSCGPDSD